MNRLGKKSKIGVLITAAVIGISFFAFFGQDEAQLQTYDGPPRAVIIDQLYDEMPNKEFHTKATEYLQSAGYSVDIVTTQDITVDYYKNLPKMNYEFVVVRTHGAENVNDVVVFTGERYSEEQYISEQLLGQVKKAAPLLERMYKVSDDGSSDWVIVNETYRYKVSPANPINESENEYFAISADLVKHAMKGKFNDTVFVLGGCNTLSNPSLGQALLDKGASTVIGWDDTVGNADNDQALLRFMDNYLKQQKNLDESIEDVKSVHNPEWMVYPANFVYLSGSA